ncbi:hypothetical protein PUATCC27989T_00495 [Phytobacter ursingii]|nr:hypothetical protein PUATCC27989T_00495 [Phytobacter ursingii]
MKYLIALLIDAAMIYLAVIFWMHGIQYAENILSFGGWFIGVINIIGYLSGRDELKEKYKHQWMAWRAYDVLTDIAFIAFSAASGWFVLASVYAVGSLLKAEFKSSTEKELSAKALA